MASKNKIGHETTGGRVYAQRISPLIAFIFYPPFKLKKLAYVKRVQDYLVGLNMFKVIHSFFYV